MAKKDNLFGVNITVGDILQELINTEGIVLLPRGNKKVNTSLGILGKKTEGIIRLVRPSSEPPDFSAVALVGGNLEYIGSTTRKSFFKYNKK